MSSSKRPPEPPAPAAETQLRSGDLAVRLESLMANATEHIRQERDLLLDGSDTPILPPKLRGRPVLVVNRKFHWQDDLGQLKRWIKDRDPVLIGVSNGVEALLDAGYHPDVAFGKVDEISDLALNECRHVVAVVSSKKKTTDDGRFERFGVRPQWFISTAKSGDLALLMADASEVPVIVEAGGPVSLNDRLGGSPDDAASAFVTRLRVSSRVVEAPAVAALSSKAVSAWPALMILLVGVLAVVAAIAMTPVGHEWFVGLGGTSGQIANVVRGNSP
ncbi:MAG: putative cytokinetic ring protein SteA [Aeromicrobium sp.]